MLTHDLSPWRHTHDYLDASDLHRQRRTEWVVLLTLVTMVVEVVAGYLTGSMALLADGWHMGSHVAALGIAAFAYRYARQQTGNARFTFGTGKVSALGGYTSALLLAMVALLMAWDSVSRLLQPIAVAYEEALVVAVLGMVVNMASAWLLMDGHDHHDHHHGAHEAHHQEHHHDHNFRGAFMHVLADLFTSVLAILALLGGMYQGMASLDSLVGLVGAGVILYWAVGLLKASGGTLLDAEDFSQLRRTIQTHVEASPDHKVVDLHVWRIGPQAQACIVSILSHNPLPLDVYKRSLSTIEGLSHVTVEVNRCDCDLPLK